MTEKSHLEPELLDELVGHLNLSSEMDDRHAAMALRQFWPRVRDEYELIRQERNEARK